MNISHIPFKVEPKDYSAQLQKAKAFLGKAYKMHPEHDPLDYPWQYEPWQLDRIEAARSKH